MITATCPAILVTLILGMAGCAACSKEYLLERRFESFSISMNHMQYAVHATLRSATDNRKAAMEITAYLEHHDDRVQTNLPSPSMQLFPPLRSREFWALVLAELDNRPLILLASDSDQLRESKILLLLRDH